MNAGIKSRSISLSAMLFCMALVLGAANKSDGKDNSNKKTVHVKVKTSKKLRRELPAPPNGKTWDLVWQDEFGGTKIDETKWNIMGDRVRQGGLWWKKNCYLNGKGQLVIKTTKEKEGYAAGALRSNGKFEKKFGLYVMRCRISGCVGHGPAFWLTASSVNNVGNEGRDGTEIDIMEKFKRGDTVQHALHWDGYGEHQKSRVYVMDIKGVADGDHIFALYWTEDEYVFYVDGIETWRTKAGGVAQVPKHIIVSDEVRTWNGDISKEKLPHYFIVDYVRVYDAVDKPELALSLPK